MSDFLDRWAAESPEHARLVAEERIVTQVIEAIWKAMEETGISKSELAQRMNTTTGEVSRLLRGSRNMSLGTLASIASALGRSVDIAEGAAPVTEDVSWPLIERPDS